MRILIIIALALLGLFVLILAFQNFESVTISFFKWSVTLPLIITVIGTYILGAFTGGMLFSMLKKINQDKQ